MTSESRPGSPHDAAVPQSLPLVQRLAIIGLGLIGSSVGLACRAHGLAKEIRGADVAPDHCAHAVALGVVDLAFADITAAVEGADMVVLAVPVGAIAPTLERIVPHLAPGAVVTDVGSVKGVVATRWIGCSRMVTGCRATRLPAARRRGRARRRPSCSSARSAY